MQSELRAQYTSGNFVGVACGTLLLAIVAWRFASSRTDDMKRPHEEPAVPPPPLAARHVGMYDSLPVVEDSKKTVRPSYF